MGGTKLFIKDMSSAFINVQSSYFVSKYFSMYRLCFLFFCIILMACQEQSKPEKTAKKATFYKKMNGITMGVIQYKITYEDKENRIHQSTIDSLLNALNMGNSHYEKASTISRFNQSETGITVENNGYDQHFIKNVQIAQGIVEKTDGYFDPTVAPLMKYYGFRKKEIEGVAAVDTLKVRQMMQTIGFDKIKVKQIGNQFRIEKTNSQTQLDFSAIAKGYAIDEVGHFLEKHGVTNYLVDIGGEARGNGVRPTGGGWRLAIQDPGRARNTPLAVATLRNLSMATSGNYESFRLVNGKKIGHTMNPKTGFSELNNLLGATVFAKDCSIADSYATAFMAMGMEKAFNLAEKLPEIEAYLVYFDENGTTVTKHTAGLEGILAN